MEASQKPAMLIALKNIREHPQPRSPFQSNYKQDPFSLERLQTEPYYILVTVICAHVITASEPRVCGKREEGCHYINLSSCQAVKAANHTQRKEERKPVKHAQHGS